MTYCLAIKVDDGLVLASDSRTHAGLDDISVYSKMHVFNAPGERLFVVLSAGNLATTQAVINLLQRDMADLHAKPSLRTVDYLSDAADYVGRLSCQVQKSHGDKTPHQGLNLGATFIVAGQIKGQAHDMYLVYPEGNCIAASPGKPYLQLGETKYGKPILDRIITPQTSLADAARCALVSLDSTMRSNLSVGPPLELAIYAQREFALQQQLTLQADAPFIAALQQQWGEGLSRVFASLPRFPWETPDGRTGAGRDQPGT
ncbi:MAG TPA: peptidase [Gammaproteobacteria bacterium]|nr:peptidase [Gammaproteobacteria bacterium]